MSGRPVYPGTSQPIRVGDKVLWHHDAPAVVLFVISADEWHPDQVASKDWFVQEFGTGIMLDTKSAGLVLEREDSTSIQFVSNASA
jgi:hypothetical protein